MLGVALTDGGVDLFETNFLRGTTVDVPRLFLLVGVGLAKAVVAAGLVVRGNVTAAFVAGLIVMGGGGATIAEVAAGMADTGITLGATATADWTFSGVVSVGALLVSSGGVAPWDRVLQHADSTSMVIVAKGICLLTIRS